MKKPKFTEGPWESGWVGEKPHGAAVVWLPTHDRVEVHTSNARANARLIASATEEGLRNCDTLADLRELLANVEGEK